MFELIKFVCGEGLDGRTLALSVLIIFCGGCWCAAGVCCGVGVWYLELIGSPDANEGTVGVCRVGCVW